MVKIITAKVLEETLTFIEENFSDEIAGLDSFLVLLVHLIIILLFVVPAGAVLLRWARARFGGAGRQEVLVCGTCREEVHEHCVKCPSCETVFPSSFLRALITLGVLYLASLTADQVDSPGVFYTLIGLYSLLALSVGAFLSFEKVRELKPAKVVHNVAMKFMAATVKGRELWAKGEAVVRVLVVLVFYASLTLGLHRFGLPAEATESGIGELLSKFSFVCGLLAFTSLAVLIAQLRRFHGFATLVLSLCSLFFFTLTCLLAHGLGTFVVEKPITSPDNWVLTAKSEGEGKIELQFNNVAGSTIKSLLTVKDSSKLTFSTSLLLMKKLEYRRYFLKTIEHESIAGSLPPSPDLRAAQVGLWDSVWAPSKNIFHCYKVGKMWSPEDERPDWAKKIGLKVDPNPNLRRWEIPLVSGKEVRLYFDGTKIYYLVEGEKDPIQLEQF
ncbi:MAG: hypothetical protein P1V97_25505 [Planctomycetota bacterium]|nr:hypothetical protein [Planctomycetota bacterium]